MAKPYPWIVESTAMVNQYYFYAIDAWTSACSSSSTAHTSPTGLSSVSTAMNTSNVNSQRRASATSNWPMGS